MDYVDVIALHCPPVIQQSVAEGVSWPNDSDQTLLFFDTTSVTLGPDCAHGVVGQLSRTVTPKRTDLYKSHYLSIAARNAASVMALEDAGQREQIVSEVERAVRGILDDIGRNHLAGLMLQVLTVYGIDLQAEITERVDYKSLTQPGWLMDWIFNQYALCMGDAEAVSRLEVLFAKTTAQNLRVIFTELTGKRARGEPCPPPEDIRQLVEPYLTDNRPTHDVDGEGPPVSHYAQLLLDAL